MGIGHSDCSRYDHLAIAGDSHRLFSTRSADHVNTMPQTQLAGQSHHPIALGPGNLHYRAELLTGQQCQRQRHTMVLTDSAT